MFKSSSLVSFLAVAAFVAAAPFPPKTGTTTTTSAESFSCECPGLRTKKDPTVHKVCVILTKIYPRIETVPASLEDDYCPFVWKQIKGLGDDSPALEDIAERAATFIEESRFKLNPRFPPFVADSNLGDDDDMEDLEVGEEGMTNLTKMRLKDNGDEVLEASNRQKHKFGTPKAADQGDF